MFDAINKSTPGARVSFMNGMLQKLGMPNESLDVICCISVLEHTDNYGEIVREFARVLKHGGLLVLTFDLSLDGKFELRKEVAADLLGNVSEFFDTGGVPIEQELNRMGDTKSILSTDHVSKTEPELLPWRFPMAKAVHDLIKGHGWTGGFRSQVGLLCRRGEEVIVGRFWILDCGFGIAETKSKIRDPKSKI